MKKYLYFASLFLLFFAFLFVDFYTKAFIANKIPLNAFGLPVQEITIFQNFFGIDFSITHILNKGIAWGAFQDLQHVILALRILVIVAMLFYLFFVEHAKAIEVSIVVILTGALGNVVDFFLYGSVVDFLKFNLWGYHFPIFNVADSLITVGVIGFFLTSMMKKSVSVVVLEDVEN